MKLTPINPINRQYDRLKVTVRLISERKSLADNLELASYGPRCVSHAQAIEVVGVEDWSEMEERGDAINIGTLALVLKVPAPAFEWASKVEAIASPVATLPSSLSGGRSRSATVHLRHIDIPVVPVLMNLGVNEMQTVANLKGKSTLLQTEINRDAVRALRQYVAAWSKATAASDEEMMQKGRRQLRDGGCGEMHSIGLDGSFDCDTRNQTGSTGSCNRLQSLDLPARAVG